MTAPRTLRTLVDVEAALDDADDRVRVNLLHAIQRDPAGADALRDGTRDVRDVLLERIDAFPHASMRLLSLLALGGLGPDARTTDRMLRSAALSVTTQEGMIALAYLAEHAPERARPFAEAALFADNPDLVRLAAGMIAHDATLAFAARLRIRCVLPAPLETAWSEDHVSALADELQGPFQAGARDLVLAYHPEAWRPLRAAWGRLDADTRTWWLDHASDVPDPDVRHDVVVAGVRDDDPAVVAAALGACARLGRQALGVDGALVRPHLASTDPRRRALAIRALGSWDEAWAAATEGGAPTPVRVAGWREVARDPDRADPGALRAALDDPAWQIRAAASEVVARRSDLADWLHPDAWDATGDAGRLALSRAALDAGHDAWLEPVLARGFAA